MIETPPAVAPDQGLLARVLRPPVIRLKKSAAITLVLAGAMRGPHSTLSTSFLVSLERTMTMASNFNHNLQMAPGN